MVILGIDPGTATTGYGVIKVPDDILGRQFDYGLELLDYGFISTPKGLVMEKRLLLLHHGIESLIKKFKPDMIALEMLFFGANSRTAMSVGQARGVMMLSAGRHGIPIEEYTGLQVKLMVAGAGRASKNEVYDGVRKFLGGGRKIKQLLSPNTGIRRRKKKFSDDAIDGIAIAICHVLKLAAK